MSEVVRPAGAEGEAPINPYSLLEAVNNSSDSANTAWLILLAVMGYLLIAVAGVTHKDLLLSSDIQLPVLQVKIDITRFFLFAPIALTLVHLGVVSQLVLLSRKTLEFDEAVRMLEVSTARTHPLRLELHNFFFVQGIAGPERSRIMSTFLHGMSWLTLVILPVLMLLYIQVVFLPFHDVAITWAHRVAVLADIAVLVLVGVFLTRQERTFLPAFLHTSVEHPVTFGMTALVMVLVAGFSFLVATIPGERLDQVTSALSKGLSSRVSVGPDRTAYGFTIPFFGRTKDGPLLGLFERNLNVTDLDLVVDKDVTPGEPTLNLRGRDLRYAKLDRTDLHQADMTGADLEGASLVGADLRGVFMQCADLSQFILSEDRKAARCARARDAVFTRAKLKDARMSGSDLAGARFDEADLEAAELSYASLGGASFYTARLEKADLTGGVDLIGANFVTASLQGADLTGAKLFGADFTFAGMQGTVLAHAELLAASLRDAELEGADLYKAKLQGADLKGAKIRAATLREAVIWQTSPPDVDNVLLTDFADVVTGALSDREAAGAIEALRRIGADNTRSRVTEALAVVTSAASRGAWTTADRQVWTQLIAASGAMAGTVPATLASASTIPPNTLAGVQQGGGAAANEAYATRLTDYLVRLACRQRWSSGSVATGLAKRAQGIEFKGNTAQLYDRMRADDCPASKTMSRKVLMNLGNQVETVRGN